jgi:hypothetical protein
LKTNEEYIKWKKAEDKKFDDKCWWDSLDKKYGNRSIE